MKIATAIKCILLGLVLLAAGVGVKLFQHYTEPERLRRIALDAFAENVEAQLSLGNLRLGPGPSLHACQVDVTPPGGDVPLFSCAGVSVHLDTGRLLKLEPVPRKVVVSSPRLNLTYAEEEDAWNFQTIKIRPQPEKPPPPREFLSDGMLLDDASISVLCRPLYDSDEPVTYDGLRLRITPDPEVQDRWSFEGDFVDGLLDGTRLSGWASGGDDGRASIRLTADAVSAGPELWQAVPFCTTVWDDFKVRGRLWFDARLDLGREGRLQTVVTARVSGGSVNTVLYPIPVHNVSGTVDVIDGHVQVHDATGLIAPSEFDGTDAVPAPVRVRVNGDYPAGDGPSVTRVQVAGLPLCRSTIESIPEAGARIWEELRPSGLCDLDLTITVMPGESTPQVVAVCDLQDATLRLNSVPLPLRNLCGRVKWDGAQLRLEGLSGSIAQPATDGGDAENLARVAVDGLYDPGHENTFLEVKVTGLRTSEDVLGAVPGLADLWDMLRPELAADVTVMLWDGPDGKGLRTKAVVRIHGGRARPRSAPLLLTDVTGTISVDDVGKITVEQLRAFLATEQLTPELGGTAASCIEVNGTLEPGAGRYEFYLEALNVPVSKELLTTMPEPGPTIWKAVQPSGIISFSGKILQGGSQDQRLSFFLDVDLKDLAGRLEALPVPLTGLTGNLLVSDRRCLSNSLTGIVCGGRFDGAAVIYYGPDRDSPSFGATLRFSQVDLTSLLEHLKGEKDEAQKVSGLLDGVVDLGGVLHGQLGTMARGRVTITEANLWQTPMFARMLPLLHLRVPGPEEAPGRGDVTFKLVGDQVIIEEFDFVGGGLNLTGQGVVGLDKSLDLTMAAVGAKDAGTGIPILSPLVGWFVRGIESQLFRIKVTGVLGDPKFKLKALSTITAPLTGISNLLLRPLLGAPEDDE